MGIVKDNLKKGVIWSFIGSLMQYGLQFLGVMVLARLLTPTDYGLIGILGIFIAVAEILTDSGLGGALVRKQNAQEIDYSTLTVYNLSVSIFFYLAYFFISPVLSNIYNEPILTPLLRMYSIVIIIHAFTIVPRIIMMKTFRFKEMTVVLLIPGLIALMCSITCAWIGFGVYSLVIQYIIEALFSSSIFMYLTKYHVKFRFSKNSFLEQFSFGFNTTVASVLKNINDNIYANVIAKTASIPQAGYYTQSWKLSSLPVKIIDSIINKSIFPVMSQQFGNEKFNNQLARLNQRVEIIVIILFCMLIPIVKELIVILLGEKWLSAEWTLKILLFTSIFYTISNINRNTLKCMAYTNLILKVETWLFVLSVLCLFISSFLGYKVIIICCLCISLIKCIVNCIVADKKINVSFIYHMKHLVLFFLLSYIAVNFSSYVSNIENIYISALCKCCIYVAIIVVGIFIYNRLFKININR